MSIQLPKPTATPRKMLADFSNALMLKCVGVAVLIHVVLIGGSSMDYILHGKSVAPPEAATATTEPAAVADANGQPATMPAGASAAPGAAASAENPADEKKMMEARKNSPMVKALTQAAKPGELPTQPAGGGLDLDDSGK